LVKTGATFADAAAEYLRYIEHDRGRKPSTLRGTARRSMRTFFPLFGSMPVEAVTTEKIERWLAAFGGSARTRNKLLIQLHGILGRAKKTYRLRGNAAAEVEKFPQRRGGDIDVFSPEEVWALVRAALPSRTPRSSSPPRSRDSGWANCSRSAGATSTFQDRRSESAPAITSVS
jgi:hypothetical protein